MLAMLIGADFTWDRFLFGYAVMGAGHLSLSYSNNYFDLAADREGRPTTFSGGTKLLIEHPELRKTTYRLALILAAASLLLAAAFTFVYRFSPLFVLFVVGGNALAWYYTAPPIRLAYRGYGEIATMIAYGLLMPGIGFLTFTSQFEVLFFLFALPLLFYGLHFIITVEFPDMEGDHRAGKKTFIVRYGRTAGISASGMLLVLGTAYFFLSSLLVPVSESIELGPVALISLIPLGLFAAVLLRMHQGRIAPDAVALANMSGIVTFLLLVNLYLFISL
jgi:1,4-dihydroxy-2-naphthoate octaprenyltransferase